MVQNNAFATPTAAGGATDFFGASPASSVNQQTPATAMSTSTPTAASGSVTGGASDFFDASPGANQQTPAVTTQPITGSALLS